MSHRRSTEKNDAQSVDKEKTAHVEGDDGVIEIAGFRVFGLDPADAEFFENFPEDRRKKVFRKVSLP